MGLLSDPEAAPSRWAHILVNYHRLFCFILCIVGYIWFCLLAHRSFNNVNNFSENALLPGLVRSEFADDQTARRYQYDFEDEIKENYATRDDMPVPWLLARMRQLNLDVYTHNFTLNFPLGKGQTFYGENVYGILRAGRTASTEALVLSVPYRPPSSHHKSTNAGIGMLLAMAKFARSRKYWAKDLIFLVTAHEQLGAQAWLQAYHDTGGPSPQWLNAGQLKGRAGAIQAAINLEMFNLRCNYIEVKIEGLNGQLPNLDLVTLVHKMCLQAGLFHSYKNSFSWVPRYSTWKHYKNSLSTLLSMVTTQVTGVPTGNHGLFHRYGIEAVTLMTVGDQGGSGRPGHALEATFRSLNNLLERFHQSYFFYLRTSTDRFLSISQYMPPLGVLCGALFIRAFAVWIATSRSKVANKTNDDKTNNDKSQGDNAENETDEKAEHVTEEDINEKGDGVKEGTSWEGENQEETKIAPPNQMCFLNVLIVMLIVHGIGYLVMTSPQLISEIGVERFSLATEEAIFYGLCIIAACLMVLLPPVLGKILHNGDIDEAARDYTLKALMIPALLELGTMMTCVGMHNFSLGFCMAAVYSPIALMISIGITRKWRIMVWSSKLLWFLLHPLLLTLIIVFVYTGATFPEEPLSVLMTRGLAASQQAIMFAIVDGMIYGNWLFNIVTSLLLPSWLLFWQMLYSYNQSTDRLYLH